MPTSLKDGALILAHPHLNDPNFKRALLLIFSYDKQAGAQGFILNKPSNKKLGEIAPDFIKTPLEQFAVNYGGPVNPESLFLLGFEIKDDGYKLHFFNSSDEALSAVNAGIFLMVFVGCSSWVTGQLENEIINNDWLRCPIPLQAVIKSDLSEVWSDAIPRINPEWKIIAMAPDNPSLN